MHAATVIAAAAVAAAVTTPKPLLVLLRCKVEWYLYSYMICGCCMFWFIMSIDAHQGGKEEGFRIM